MLTLKDIDEAVDALIARTIENRPQPGTDRGYATAAEAAAYADGVDNALHALLGDTVVAGFQRRLQQALARLAVADGQP